jgi:hypothetical protein
MPKLQIELSRAALDRLQLLADDFNAQTGQALSLEQWLVLHLSEMAIGKQLAAEMETIKRDVDTEVNRRIAARRRELLDALGQADAV